MERIEKDINAEVVGVVPPEEVRRLKNHSEAIKHEHYTVKKARKVVVMILLILIAVFAVYTKHLFDVGILTPEMIKLAWRAAMENPIRTLPVIPIAQLH